MVQTEREVGSSERRRRGFSAGGGPVWFGWGSLCEGDQRTSAGFWYLCAWKSAFIRGVFKTPSMRR